MQHCPLGVYVVPSDTLLHWDGVLFLHQGLLLNSTFTNQLYVNPGYYADAIMKFRLTFPRNFPEQPPSVHFVTDVFHPLVSQQDGRFNLAPRFHSWRYGRPFYPGFWLTLVDRRNTMFLTFFTGSKPRSNAFSWTNCRKRTV
jgi:Ubiquitin-conjugating enzyme